MGASRWSPTCGSSAASLLPRSLATSASSTTGALRECSSRKARGPIASSTRRHSVCARRATLCSTKGGDGRGTRRWTTARLRLTTTSPSSTSTSRKLGEWVALLRRACLPQSPSLHRLRRPLRRQHHVLEPRLELRRPLLQRLHAFQPRLRELSADSTTAGDSPYSGTYATCLGTNSHPPGHVYFSTSSC
jgi:hypothetical protein